ncbi:MAG: hypothetical protein R3C10_00145 [Pirellulales bacterium]
MILSLLVSSSASRGAYLLEVDTDGSDDGVLTYHVGFSFTNDTTIASQSTTSTAFGMTGGDSIFGGDGTLFFDTYRYAYNPATQADNLDIPPRTDLGEGNLATGNLGGGPGTYNVYATWPYTSNVSGGPTRYTVFSSGNFFTVDINQNDVDPGESDGRGDVWVFLGNIEYTGGGITVEQQPTDLNTFISMRAAGILFELAEPNSLPGDGNGDGWVDGLDYLLWAGAFGAHPGSDGDVSDGDFNDDGWVDGLDYLLWAGNFGSHASTNVPEPGAFVLVLMGSLLLTARRQTR